MSCIRKLKELTIVIKIFHNNLVFFHSSGLVFESPDKEALQK